MNDQQINRFEALTFAQLDQKQALDSVKRMVAEMQRAGLKVDATAVEELTEYLEMAGEVIKDALS